MDFAAFERHKALSQAHLTIAQSIKYPETVGPQALDKARKLVDAHAVLSAQMRKPTESRARANLLPQEAHDADPEA